jgi:alkylation response protein AidB-like acyl-CoA dehydrogenase
MTEPEVTGSDPTLLQTRAVRDGDEWVINGHKWFTSGALGAAFAIVMCVSDPDAPARRRMSQIIVPTDTPGFNNILKIAPEVATAFAARRSRPSGNAVISRHSIPSRRAPDGSRFAMAAVIS